MNRIIWPFVFISAFLLCFVIGGTTLLMVVFSIGLLTTFASLWKTAIRNRSFGILGFSDLLLKKPRAAKLDYTEVTLFFSGLSMIAGVFLAIFVTII